MKVLITGASSGIGRDFARLLKDSYDEIVIVSRNKEALNNLKDEIQRGSNAVVKVVATDLSIEENVINVYEENKDMDLVINNAGVDDFGKFSETDLEKELSMINTNITALHILTKLYLKSMKEKDSGHILNVASIAGFMPGPLMATYYATKNYVVRLSEAIYEELRREKSNVKISVLCPGPVDTNFNNVANVSFALKGLKSIDVASYALKHLNRFYITLGLGVKLARFGAHFMPSLRMARIAYNVQKKKL